MKRACCNFCLAFIKVETGYNPMIHRRYCSLICFKKDAKFEEDNSDENIGLRNYELYGINTHTREKRHGENGRESGD